MRKGHGNVGTAAGRLVSAAKSGEENEVADAIAGVLKACSACHYNLRDAGRRKKMK